MLSVADVVAELADQCAADAAAAGGPDAAAWPGSSGSSGPRDAVARWVLVGLGFAWLGDCLGDPLLLKIAFFFGTQAGVLPGLPAPLAVQPAGPARPARPRTRWGWGV